MDFRTSNCAHYDRSSRTNSAEREIDCEALEAKSRHYFERMRLFEFLEIDSGIIMTEHDSSGRFIPPYSDKDSTP